MSTRTNKALGGIAGAVALAAGTQAYGIVPVAVPANLAGTIGVTNTRGWDVNGDTIVDFTFRTRFPNVTSGNGVIWQGSVLPTTALANAVVGYAAGISYGTNLSFGQNVGPTPPAGASFRTAAQVSLASIYRYAG